MKIFVKAKPGSRQELVEKIDEQNYIVKVKEQPEKGKYLNFDHLTFYVGNAKQVGIFTLNLNLFKPRFKILIQLKIRQP